MRRHGPETSRGLDTNPKALLAARHRGLLVLLGALTACSAPNNPKSTTSDMTEAGAGGQDSGVGGEGGADAGYAGAGGTGGVDSGTAGGGSTVINCGEGKVQSKQTEKCIPDPCDDVCTENTESGCTINPEDQAVVKCKDGFAQNENCCSCDTESGLYENDYPKCSADVTPPNAPVITTILGIIHQADYTLDGTTDPDTHEIWHNIDGGPFKKLENYIAFDTNFSYEGNIPNEFEADDVCFKAIDLADNESGTGCKNFARLP